MKESAAFVLGAAAVALVTPSGTGILLLRTEALANQCSDKPPYDQPQGVTITHYATTWATALACPEYNLHCPVSEMEQTSECIANTSYEVVPAATRSSTNCAPTAMTLEALDTVYPYLMIGRTLMTCVPFASGLPTTTNEPIDPGNPLGTNPRSSSTQTSASGPQQPAVSSTSPPDISGIDAQGPMPTTLSSPSGSQLPATTSGTAIGLVNGLPQTTGTAGTSIASDQSSAVPAPTSGSTPPHPGAPAPTDTAGGTAATGGQTTVVPSVPASSIASVSGTRSSSDNGFQQTTTRFVNTQGPGAPAPGAITGSTGFGGALVNPGPKSPVQTPQMLLVD
jgi:hypothetical protein